ncbi:MAG TPA: GatB/YqeY domain-containing protein [Candidatus Marinimicrobia bacterium]|nr:GatB/YqeY domain-containing protein [Candidatus Neomarinimicrobiota bacterium]
MSLLDTIQSDMYAAMKSGDKHKTGTLRVALSKLKDKKIEKREDLSDVEALKIIQNLVKQRKEAADIYKENGRNDLMENENAELEILNAYLPKMMSEDDLRVLVKKVVEDTGASGLSDIGKVMPEVMKQSAGKADGKMAQSIVRELLQ